MNASTTQAIDAVEGSIRTRAVRGVFWATLQNWSARGLSLVLFFVLARLLTPAQLGLAAAINLVIATVNLVAEQGFGDALVQRRGLTDQDINLPFFSALVVATLAALCILIGAEQIERWMHVPGLAPLLRVAALIVPLTAVSLFQEALYRRRLAFKQIALRMLITGVAGSVFAVICAAYGMGSWSLVVQAISTTGMNALWLWRTSPWRPTLNFNYASYRHILRFSLHILSSRVLEIVATRAIEPFIAVLYGPAALGFYAIGSRVFQTTIQLFSTSLMNVSLGALSGLTADMARMRQAFLKMLSANAAFMVPAFVAGAAVAPEASHVMFGERWSTSADVMAILMVLGAMFSWQFVTGPLFSALGRPQYLVWMALGKAIAGVAGMSLAPTHNVAELTFVFAVSQLATTPLTYVLLRRCLSLNFMSLLSEVWPFYLAAISGYAAVHFCRHALTRLDPNALWLLLALSAAYVATYLAIALTFGRRQALQVWKLARPNVPSPEHL
jgi:O-antigen/teichoic acid export membrane protein